METLIIVLVVVVVLLVVAGLVVLPRIRGRQREQRQLEARQHLQEAQRVSAQAEADRAAAEEQAARTKRERAEAELRAAEGERDAREQLADAERRQAEAQQLHEKAARLDPGLRADPETSARRDTVQDRDDRSTDRAGADGTDAGVDQPHADRSRAEGARTENTYADGTDRRDRDGASGWPQQHDVTNRPVDDPADPRYDDGSTGRDPRR